MDERTRRAAAGGIGQAVLVLAWLFLLKDSDAYSCPYLVVGALSLLCLYRVVYFLLLGAQLYGLRLREARARLCRK